MALLKAVVLLDVVKVVLADDKSPQHLYLGYNTKQDLANKGAFLVTTDAFDGLPGHPEAQTNILAGAGASPC